MLYCLFTEKEGFETFQLLRGATFVSALCNLLTIFNILPKGKKLIFLTISFYFHCSQSPKRRRGEDDLQLRGGPDGDRLPGRRDNPCGKYKSLTIP